MKTWSKIALGIVGGLLALGVLGSMLDGDDATPSESAEPSQPEGSQDVADTKPETPRGPGCDGERDCARLTLTSVERRACLGSTGGLCADDGSEYLIVRASVTNTGTNEVSTNPYYFQAQREGARHDIASATFFEDGAMDDVTLQEGGTQAGTLVFELPQGATVTEICFEPPVFTFGDTPRYCAPVEG